MSYSKRKNILFAILIGLVLLFTACSADGNKDDNAKNKDKINNSEEGNNGDVEEYVDNTDPVTLRVAVGASEEDFERVYKGPVEEKYPHITVEQVEFAPNKDTIEAELMKGNVPDIIFGGNSVQLHTYEEYDLLRDHTDLIEQHGFNLELFDEGFLERIRSHSADRELWALPIDMTRYALHYNKDIFDMFGVDYPTNDMTWQEVYELSKKVTGEMGGQQYDGLQLTVFDTMLSTISAPLVDPETDEPLFTKSDELKNLFELYQNVYDQGPEPDLSAIGPFIGEQTLAMLPIYFLYSDWTGLKTAEENGMNWDIVTYPIWDEKDPRTGMAGGRWLAVTDTSEHPNQAFQALALWLDRGNVGEILEGPVSIPYNVEETKDYVAEVGLDKGLDNKNVDALFKNPTLSERPEVSKYEYDLYPLLVETVNEFIDPAGEASKDINTVLRETQEKAEIIIDEKKTSK